MRSNHVGVGSVKAAGVLNIDRGFEILIERFLVYFRDKDTWGDFFDGTPPPERTEEAAQRARAQVRSMSICFVNTWRRLTEQLARNFALKLMDFVLRMMNFVLKLMDFVVKLMMTFVGGRGVREGAGEEGRGPARGGEGPGGEAEG